MNSLRYDWSTIVVLWRRDLVRFLRQPSRIAGALGQPIIFWLVIGAGMAPTFSIAGLSIDYLEYFFPGVVVMVLLFASIFSSISVIDDRRQGFLQAVMAGPGSRAALVLGKCLGSASVAMIQAGIFLLLAPFAGFTWGETDWPLLLGTMALASLGLTAFGFLIAWLLDNVQAYHAIQMTILMPLWVLSGAMFPANPQSPFFSSMMAANPVAYAVTAVRHSFYPSLAPSETVLPHGPMWSLTVLALFAGVSLLGAIMFCRRRA